MNKSNVFVVLTMMYALTGPALAQEQLTGVFSITQTSTETGGEQLAEALRDFIAADEPLKWQLYVPDTYHSARPPGVFIFLDPQGWGGIPDAWLTVFQDHNLIWVGPRKTGPDSPQRNVWSAILGLRAIEQQYAIDLNRLYIGSSGSAAAMTAVNTALFANEIKGVVYMRGSVFWTSMDEDRLESLRRKRHVFITGTNDKSKGQIRDHFERYKETGINNSKLIFDNQRIGDMPDPEHMDEAIRYLDGY